jgi:hypothetical protein
VPVQKIDPFRLTASEIAALLREDLPLIPELESLRANPAELAVRPGMKHELEQSAEYMAGSGTIPETRYTHYRYFIKNGDRSAYEGPYFDKRRIQGMLALRVFTGEMGLKDPLQDYLWNICEETTWVAPAHERRDIIDLFAAETAFDLAATLHLLGRTLDPEVRARVRCEVDRRIFQPYLAHYNNFGWYKGGNNWNGVCNSSVASTFLLLETEPDRVAQALVLALDGLNYFLDHAFEADGTSTEGGDYWHYGLINFVSLSEMLRARSGGAIDLLDSERVRRIAAYPAKLLLSGSMLAAFSDADEIIHFNPGIITRLAERTGEATLYNLLAKPVEFPGEWRLVMMLRKGLWWDGSQREAPQIDDAVLTGGGVARLVAPLAGSDQPVIVALKAGHNAENHNQNDVGSFLVHVQGESLLTDPGRGLYNRFYFSERRYENIFANSFGHSVPRIGGQLQAPGHEFHGELVEAGTSGAFKRALVEFARAYPVAGLSSLRRELKLAADPPQGAEVGTIWLEDTFQFTGVPLEVEEAFVTWCDVELRGASALVKGQRHSLRLTIESPAGTLFAVQALEEECRANAKAGVLKRLSASLPLAQQITFRLRLKVEPSL